jgi:hypothetical protein
MMGKPPMKNALTGINKEEARIQEEARVQTGARTQAEANQNKVSLKEEYERELRKKIVHDMVYGVDRHYPLPTLQYPPLQHPPPIQIPESSVMQEWKMKDAVKDAVRDEIQWDRFMHSKPYKSKYR